MRQNNRRINRLRSAVERVIASVLTGRVLYTGFRRPIASYGQVFSVVRALIFCVAPDSLMNKPFDKESKHIFRSRPCFQRSLPDQKRNYLTSRVYKYRLLKHQKQR